jgi:hypothetical protein
MTRNELDPVAWQRNTLPRNLVKSYLPVTGFL